MLTKDKYRGNVRPQKRKCEKCALDLDGAGKHIINTRTAMKIAEDCMKTPAQPEAAKPEVPKVEEKLTENEEEKPKEEVKKNEGN